MTNLSVRSLRTAIVTVDVSDELPPELELAIAHTPQNLRDRLRTHLAFDQRLSRIVSGTTEPMLGQMRLAWWRDMLGKPVGERPSGDAVLYAIGVHWPASEPDLVALVDAWEVLIVAEELSQKELLQFAQGRGQPFARLLDSPDRADEDDILAAASQWALADTAARISDIDERSHIIEAGLALTVSGRRCPRELKGLAILAALGQRALKRGGRPLMEGRGAALTAFRASIFRR